MPEYLSPGVYVEEVSTGSKPIEGVSTSTTGMVGVTERGPEHVPILVTSSGEFTRIFGGPLDFRDFTNPATGVIHAYLPHSVEGFFTNGGRRAYIVRVLPDDAAHAARPLFDRGAAGGADTLLVRTVPRDSGTALNQPPLYALLDANLAVDDFVRIGDGSRSEYRRVAAIGANSLHVALNFPLGAAHPAGTSVDELARAADTANYTTGDFVLDGDVNSGATTITVAQGTTLGDVATLLGLPGDAVFEIGDPAAAEYVVATAATDLGANRVRLTLASPLLMDYANATVVQAIDISAAPATSANLDLAANGGDILVYLDNLGGGFTNTANLVVIDPATANREVRRIGSLSSMTLDLGAYVDYPQASVAEFVDMQDDNEAVATAAGPANTATAFDVTGIGGLAVGMTIDVGGDAGVISAIDATALRITLQAALAGGVPADGTTITPAAKSLTAQARRNAIVLSLNNRLGLQAGDVLRLGIAPDEEYVTIATVSGPRGVAPDAGTVILTSPLVEAHADGTALRRQHPPQADPTRHAAITLFEIPEDGTTVYVNDGTVFAASEVIRFTLPNGAEFYHRLTATNTGLDARTVTLTTSVNFSHEAGGPLVERDPLFDVRALDRGAWGNRLLAAVEDEENGLASRAEVDAFNPPLELNLTTLTGVEAGTILELRDPVSEDLIGGQLKVRSVDRSANNLVILDGALDAVQIAALNAAQLAGTPLLARSREFRLTVLLLERPHPAIPARNEDILDSETFRHLSMDPRHSRYIHRIIGTTWVDGATEDDDGNPLRLADQRSEGESAYIRVRDRAPDAATEESVRLGPETLIDILPSGRTRAARHRLGNTDDPAAGFVVGSDSVDTMAGAMYEGVDDNEPRDRSGIFALKNIQDISLVAVPGQTGAAVQQALIDHCEAERYRFAVLDAHGPDDDSLNDVQFQRQQFDTKYAALYHPWLTIPEPMPLNLTNIQQAAVPSSGHVLGIYARTDNERGVHKAPANAVVRGITGLTRYLNMREHDILNPFPKNINVIRDFREDNRGLRVWGARVITSDSDYKYVNVRRLLIFLEASIDRGLQWVVFEPNAEELWSRVRRSISNFLTVVWRNGALEGTTVEQAFFVKCDRTTMTQTDIDNGRLICVIGVAPVKPAEFVIVRIGLWTANAQQ